MSTIKKIQVTTGVYWVEIPEADVYMLCGCPADSVKHLMKRGLIVPVEEKGVKFESGPNAILLSDAMIQNGEFSNLAEFPVLQMLYRQGMILPGHPGNTGTKPLLIGSKEQIKAQLEYIYRGNYGLCSKEEMLAAGTDEAWADELMRLKLKFAFGKIRDSGELIDTLPIEGEAVTIKNGATVRRVAFNWFEIGYNGDRVLVDLSMEGGETYPAPYPLGQHHMKRSYFTVIHSGQGDGWDQDRPCMGSIIMFQGKIYLVDAGPNLSHTLNSLGIGISEIEGIFHTHCHDDHFAGLTSLMRSDHKIKYFATKLVRHSVAKKLAALLDFDEDQFSDFFEVHDMEFNDWYDIEGLEVKPVFSPHPVETNLFIFRTIWDGGFKTYAHFADISSFKTLDGMIGDDGLTAKTAERVKNCYMTKASLKKIDVGGGMIHGDAEDFRNDPSEKIILSHLARKLENREKEIGSGSPFGVVDVLIPDYQDFLRRNAFHYLVSYFPEIQPYKVRALMNTPMRTFNPESILIKEGKSDNSIYLILTGQVERIRSGTGTASMLYAGTMAGELFAMTAMPASHTYRAASFVDALEISKSLYMEFVDQNHLFDGILVMKEKREFLRETRLFGAAVSYPVHNRIAQEMGSQTLEDGQTLEPDRSCLYMVRSGRIHRMCEEDSYEKMEEGDFFGEETAVFNKAHIFTFKAEGKTELFTIPGSMVADIPVVRWKLLETHERRATQVGCWI